MATINHLLRVTPYDAEIANKISTMVENFVKTTKHVASHRYEIPKKLGGLGLLEIKSTWCRFNAYWLINLNTSEYTWAKLMRRNLDLSNEQLLYDGCFIIDRILRRAPHCEEFRWGLIKTVEFIGANLGVEMFVDRQDKQVRRDTLVNNSIYCYWEAMIVAQRDRNVQDADVRMEYERMISGHQWPENITRPVLPFWIRLMGSNKEELKDLMKSPKDYFDKIFSHVMKFGVERENVMKVFKESNKSHFPLNHWFITHKLITGSLKTNLQISSVKHCSMCKIPQFNETVEHLFYYCHLVANTVQAMEVNVTRLEQTPITLEVKDVLLMSFRFKPKTNYVYNKVKGKYLSIVYRYKTNYTPPPPSLAALILNDFLDQEKIYDRKKKNGTLGIEYED